MSNAAIHRGTSREPMTRRSSLGRKINQSTFMLLLAIGGLILLLALFILFHENANATRGYYLRTLESQRSRLLLEEEVVKMKIAEAQALENLESDKRVQVMIPVKNAKYYKPEEKSVALE